MAHYHSTDINHGHGINDPSHSHKFSGNKVVENYGFVSGGYYAGDATLSLYENWTEMARTNISVNDTGPLNKSSGNSLYFGTGNERNYTASNNGNANESRPENFTVKIWKRTA